MDIKRSKRNTHTIKLVFVLIAVGLLFGAYFAVGTTAQGEYLVAKEHIRTATVIKGPLTLTVRAPGNLVSTDIRWLATQVDGTVEQVLVKPGSMVELGQTIAVLSNPRLQQQLDELTWDLESLRAETQAHIQQLRSQLLDQKSLLAEAQANYESTTMEFTAQTTLRERKLGSISQIAYESIRLKKEQHEQRLSIEKERMTNLHASIEAQTLAKQAALKKLEQQIAQAHMQVEALRINAKIAGMVQEVSIESGQQLAMGATIAKLAKQNELIAQLNVPELQIIGVALGQAVEIDTRQHILKGTVTRVAPSIVAGTVEVDVAFLEAPPKTLRPDLSIEGEIVVRNIDNALYVKRPAYSQNHRTLPIFKLNAQETHATKNMVEFGEGSMHEIQILAGLKAGDRIITSAPNELDKYESIKIQP